MDENNFIKIKEIEPLYKEHCKEIGIKFSRSDFINFLEFLKIDFYDWIQSNLGYFEP